MQDSHEKTYFLALDTSTPCSTVAVTSGCDRYGTVLGSVSLSSDVTHSRRLLTSIDWLLASAEIEKEMIDGYAVGLGPGSFTGLRIGMATAKGLAAAAGKPLYGISTLEVIAARCQASQPVRVVLDARKKEVYTALFSQGDTGVEMVGEIEALTPAQLVERIEEPTLLAGDGLRPYREYWQEELGDRIRVAPAHLWSPSAATLGLLVGGAARDGKPLPAGATPLYVRASDAELNLKRKSS